MNIVKEKKVISLWASYIKDALIESTNSKERPFELEKFKRALFDEKRYSMGGAFCLVTKQQGFFIEHCTNNAIKGTPIISSLDFNRIKEEYKKLSNKKPYERNFLKITGEIQADIKQAIDRLKREFIND